MPKRNYRIEVVNMRHAKDFGSKRGDFKIDRTTMWGNPFHLGEFTRAESIACYEDYFKKNLLSKISILATANRLGCHCKQPGSNVACHGDVIRKYLIKYLDSLERQETLDGKTAFYKDPKRK
jgi:hypothetical protein